MAGDTLESMLAVVANEVKNAVQTMKERAQKQDADHETLILLKQDFTRFVSHDFKSLSQDVSTFFAEQTRKEEKSGDRRWSIILIIIGYIITFFLGLFF